MPTFKEIVKIYHRPATPKSCSVDTANFQEFRQVYGEQKPQTADVCPKLATIRPKTIKLEVPIFGTEKAIVPVPVRTKRTLPKPILKKTTPVSDDAYLVSSTQESNPNDK